MNCQSEVEPGSVSGALERALSVLRTVVDIVETPVDGPEPPEWCVRRGWAPRLLALSESELASCEERGLGAVVPQLASCPAEWLELSSVLRACTSLPRLASVKAELPSRALRGVSARKREQLAEFIPNVAALVRRSERVVDVGAGAGHLSRLVAELFQRDAWALDRDAQRLERGRSRCQDRAREVGELNVRFVEAHVGEHELEFAPNDLALGLHACGELGDRLVQQAARVRCHVGLVSCCLQKTQAERRMSMARAARGFTLRRSALGLANLTARAEGVEATLAENLRAREARLALRYLLCERGIELKPGEEMRGINRRRAVAGFAELSAHALAVLGLPAASPAELRAHVERARRDYAVMRRLSLPRNWLSRLVEVAIVLDRGARLEEAGLHVRVAQLFEQRVTPRNTVLFASRDAQLLPPLSGESARGLDASDATPKRTFLVGTANMHNRDQDASSG
ncbi:MAG TPA: methyltransferase [Polyangiaceae bacterium]|nr:methyltransferase [Polyangiaceae bacterium]